MMFKILIGLAFGSLVPSCFAWLRKKLVSSPSPSHGRARQGEAGPTPSHVKIEFFISAIVCTMLLFLVAVSSLYNHCIMLCLASLGKPYSLAQLLTMSY